MIQKPLFYCITQIYEFRNRYYIDCNYFEEARKVGLNKRSVF